jgi:hypothetical protein
VDAARAAQTANAQKFDAARRASEAGYVIPPADLEPGAVSEAVSGLSGKIKTAQTASQRNQVVTDRLARQALGLQHGDELTAATLQKIRDQAASKGYEPIRSFGSVQADRQYYDALSKISATQQGASKSFPGLADNGVQELTARLAQPVFDAGDAIDATRVLRAAADKAYSQGDKTLGKANRQAADALEEMLDRYLSGAGQPDALKAFRDARQLIAKTYSVQSGLNPQTGSVAAPKLAAQLAKGKPLSDELRLVAETATAFPKATQMLTEAPKQLSPLDFAVALGSAASSGHVAPLALLAARPLARNILLSGPVQARAVQQTAPVPLTQAAQMLMENRLMQLGLRPVGTAAGIELGR